MQKEKLRYIPKNQTKRTNLSGYQLNPVREELKKLGTFLDLPGNLARHLGGINLPKNSIDGNSDILLIV